MKHMPGSAHSSQSRRQLLRRALFTGSILAAAGFQAAPAVTIRAGAMLQEAGGGPLLIDSATLNARIAAGAAPVVLLDLGDLAEYRDGHLPGAIHSYWLETVERDYDVYGTVLNQFDEAGDNENQGKRLAWMRRYGIGPDSEVIAYDHGDGRRAARIVWFLHFLGHGRASMLDGGYRAWSESGQPVTRDAFEPDTPPVDPIVMPQSGFYVSTSGLIDALADSATLLIDVRTDEERGDTVDGQFATGVIPGSIRASWRDLLRPDASGMVDEPTARAILEAAGITPERRIILYGQFGCDTNIVWLILKRSGFPSVEVYDRGWIEWSSTSGLPVEP